jgi:hypothetical protein
MTTFDEEFADLPDLELDPRTQARHLAYLASLPDDKDPVAPRPRRPRRSRRGFIIGGVVAVVAAGGGVGVAAALGAFRATDTSTAFCYSSLTLDNRDRTEYATEGNAAGRGLEICAKYWQSGALQTGRPVDPQLLPTGGNHPVPDLVACVLPDGRVGIFPGTAPDCGRLGLPVYTGK